MPDHLVLLAYREDMPTPVSEFHTRPTPPSGMQVLEQAKLEWERIHGADVDLSDIYDL